MSVKLSKEKQGKMAIAGHVGCGHCHSHNQFLQDDSGGLATVLALFREATDLSLTIKDVAVKTGAAGFIEVYTAGGGYGKAYARRGITLQEACLAKTVIGQDAVLTQSLAMQAYGRFYGQGVHETPVALQTAIANAALDTFVKNHPDEFAAGDEGLEGSCGLMAGAVLDFDGVPVSVLGTVNASCGGIGPNEDLEGNVAIGNKRNIMSSLGMLNLPTIVVEGKIFSAMYSAEVNENTFMIRADPQDDNPFIADSLENAAKKLNLPHMRKEVLMARVQGGMQRQTQELGDKISALGLKLAAAHFAKEKIDILAQLAVLISQDGAGISFMSNHLHEIVGGTGMLPASGAVVNYVVPYSYQQECLFPFLTDDDLARYVKLVKTTVQELSLLLPQAVAHLEKYGLKSSLDTIYHG